MGHLTLLTVSVIIPTYHRPDRLRECLRGLARQTLAADQFEVIVVDDGSPEPIGVVVREFAGSLVARVVVQRNAGPGAARNAGVAVARGRFIAFIDDDCVPQADWLSVLVNELERDDSVLFGGLVENALVRNRYADANDRISHFVYDYYRSPDALETFFTTNNIGLSVDRFRDLGGFSATIPAKTAEDKEFCDRWRAAGLELRHAPGAIVYHAHELTLRSFVRQHFNYGRGILAFRLMRRERTRSPVVPEPLRFYARLVTSPLRHRSSIGTLTSIGLILLSQLATAAGAMHQAFRWPADHLRVQQENQRAAAAAERRQPRSSEPSA